MKKADIPKQFTKFVEKIEDSIKKDFLDKFIQKINLDTKTGKYVIDYADIEEFYPKKPQKAPFSKVNLIQGLVIGLILSFLILIVMCFFGVSFC
jgi:hypothetical protein